MKRNSPERFKYHNDHSHPAELKSSTFKSSWVPRISFASDKCCSTELLQGFLNSPYYTIFPCVITIPN
nr:hypothetical transcript [Hymenolepis microstoma]